MSTRQCSTAAHHAKKHICRHGILACLPNLTSSISFRARLQPLLSPKTCSCCIKLCVRAGV